MTNTQNPFTNPQLLHPELADQISTIENWQTEHGPVAQIGIVGVAAAVQKAANESAGRGQIEAVSAEFAELLASTRNELVSLLTDAKMEASFSVPPLSGPEFMDIDWPHLEAGFQAYKRLGLQPDIVITPNGRDLESWRTLYSHLCDWQATRPLHAPGIWLDSVAGGKGLFVQADVAAQWKQIVPTEPGWQVSVIAGTRELSVVDVDRTGKGFDGWMPERLAEIVERQPMRPGATIDKLDASPSVEDYLIQQAIHFHRGMPAMNDDLTMTWLDGKLDGAGTFDAYPCGSAIRTAGRPGYRIDLSWYEANSIDTKVGIRPIIKG